MKIAIDCADLDSSRIDGTRIYIKNVLNYLGDLAPQDDFWLFHRKEFNPVLKPKIFSNYQNRKIPYPFLWTQTKFAFELLQLRPAIVWMPIQQIPLLTAGKIKIVFTAHDLAFKIFPKSFKLSDRKKLNFFIDSAVRRADGIIAVSQSTKKDLLRFFPLLEEEKIKVIYHGFDAQQFCQKFSQEEINKNLNKYNLIKDQREVRFLLYVGALQPRKNLPLLIEAFEEIKGKKGLGDLRLVLVGAPAWLAEETLRKVRNSVFSQDIILTGEVDFSVLTLLYRKAKLLVFPSLYEGFGLPILEGWASETPVLVADNSSLKEIGGMAVEKFSTFSKKDLADKVEKLLADESLRKDLVIKGKKALENFSWKKCAEETLEFLKIIAQKND